MPNHSKTFLERINNPKGLFKSEEDHIAHVKIRMKERFDIEMSDDDYYQLLKDIQKKNNFVYCLSATSALYELPYREKLIWVIYGSKGKNNHGELPSRIKTILKPDGKCPVPLKLAHKFDQISFTEAIHDVIEQILKISNELDMNDRKSFFIKDYPNTFKNGALKIKQGYSPQSAELIRIAVVYLLTIHGIQQTEE